MRIGLIKDVATGTHVNQLCNILYTMETHPEWFDPAVLPAASDFCNSELAAIARDLSAQNEKAALAGSFNAERRNNLIIPIVPAWRHEGKEVSL